MSSDHYTTWVPLCRSWLFPQFLGPDSSSVLHALPVFLVCWPATIAARSLHADSVVCLAVGKGWVRIDTGFPEAWFGHERFLRTLPPPRTIDYLKWHKCILEVISIQFTNSTCVCWNLWQIRAIGWKSGTSDMSKDMKWILKLMLKKYFMNRKYVVGRVELWAFEKTAINLLIKEMGIYCKIWRSHSVTATVMKVIIFFWGIAPYSPYMNKRFRGLYHFHLHGWKSSEQ
jgi:hypothetical protein